MNNEHSQRGALILGVAVIMLVMGAAVGSIAFPMTRTKTITFTLYPTQPTTQLSTAIASSSFTSTSQSASCINLAPTIGVELQVVAQNAGPVSGLVVNGEDVWYCNNQKQVIAISLAMTNSSGWVSLRYGGDGLYYLNVTYSQYLVYSLSIVTQPTSLTYAVFNASTGSVSTHFCEFEVNCITGAG